MKAIHADIVDISWFKGMLQATFLSQFERFCFYIYKATNTCK